MLLLYFSQCSTLETLSNSPGPIIEKCKWWERQLKYAATIILHNRSRHCVFFTYDEHAILILQKMIRDEEISSKDVKIINRCNCNNKEFIEQELELDLGDILSDVKHGFFNQRLKYLR